MTGPSKRGPRTVHSATSRSVGTDPDDRKPLPLGANARRNARIVLVLVLVGLGIWTAASFLPALVWATILAVALWPLYVAFATRLMGGPSGTAALVFTVCVALVLMTPIAIAAYQLAHH